MVFTNPIPIEKFPDSWQIASIDSLCLNVTSGGTPLRSIVEYYENGSIPWIKTKELKDWYIEEVEEKITLLGLKNSSAKVFPPNTVLMAMYGDGKTITSLGLLRKEAATNQACCALIVDSLKCDFIYLFYALKFHRPEFLQLATGGAQRNLSGSLIRNFAIRLPPLPEQHAIADVLSVLDDKIELNRRMNQTLEELAQTLFKHMFIDNPDREGWEEKRLDYVCSFEYGKALKADVRHEGKIPVFGSNGCVGYHDEYLVKGPGIVVGRKGNPGIVTFAYTDFFPIDTTFFVTPKNGTSLYWLYYTLIDLNLPNFGTDSAVPGLNRNIAYLSEINIPPNSLIEEFETIVKPMFEKIYANDQENQTLAELRDTLLPKLMSGQVRVRPS